MVECEFHELGLDIYKYNVLIDTWWNVNVYLCQSLRRDMLRFNRYMVECECVL